MGRWRPFAYYLVVLLFRGIFQDQQLVRILLAADGPGRNLDVVTVIADSHFDFLGLLVEGLTKPFLSMKKTKFFTLRRPKSCHRSKASPRKLRAAWVLHLARLHKVVNTQQKLLLAKLSTFFFDLSFQIGHLHSISIWTPAFLCRCWGFPTIVEYCGVALLTTCLWKLADETGGWDSSALSPLQGLFFFCAANRIKRVASRKVTVLVYWTSPTSTSFN